MRFDYQSVVVEFMSWERMIKKGLVKGTKEGVKERRNKKGQAKSYQSLEL